MATKVSFDTLPEELILLILDHLDNLSNLQPLNALNKTNRHLHRLTLSRLYRRFPGLNSDLFLRTTSQSPHLASYIKSAIWHTERKTVPRIDMLEKRHIVTRLNQLAVPHGTDLAEQFAKFGKSEDYWYMEVLLLFMPNVESLEICDSWLWDDHHYWFKSLSPFFNPLCQSKLKSATLYGPLRIDNVVPLLTIPTLRTLELTQVVVMRREGYRVFQWSVWPVDRLLPVGASGLETLTLKESYIDVEYLLPIFRSIKALTSFTYEHVPNDLADESAEVDHISSTALSSCLAVQVSSLSHLRLRDTHARDWSTAMDHFCDFLAETSLSQLQTLDIGPFEPTWFRPRSLVEAVTALVNDLPPSLKRLRLKIETNHWAEDLDAFLSVFANEIASTRPSLDDVKLIDWSPMLGWFPNNFPALQSVYRDLGLRLGSVSGDIHDFYETEPLLMDEHAEEGWIVVTDLKLGSVA